MSAVNNNLEYICAFAAEDPEGLIQKSEQRYMNIINAVCKRITEGTGHEIVMLAGPSAAGKTTTALKIKAGLQEMGHKAYTVSLDDFYKNTVDAPLDENGNPDFEAVYSLDLDTVTRCMNELIEQRRSELPLFDFMTGTRRKETNTIELDQGDVIIVEGLHALNPVITEHLPQTHLLKLYINVASRIYDKNRHIVLNKRNMRFVRRLVRDYQFRNSSVENTYHLWESVTAGEEKYLFPYKKCADVLINSIHIYEPCVLKAEVIKMLKDLPKDNRHYREAGRLIRSLEKFPDIPREAVPESSLLREFLG